MTTFILILCKCYLFTVLQTSEPAEEAKMETLDVVQTEHPAAPSPVQMGMCSLCENLSHMNTTNLQQTTLKSFEQKMGKIHINEDIFTEKSGKHSGKRRKCSF